MGVGEEMSNDSKCKENEIKIIRAFEKALDLNKIDIKQIAEMIINKDEDS